MFVIKGVLFTLTVLLLLNIRLLIRYLYIYIILTHILEHKIQQFYSFCVLDQFYLLLLFLCLKKKDYFILCQFYPLSYVTLLRFDSTKKSALNFCRCFERRHNLFFGAIFFLVSFSFSFFVLFFWNIIK